MIKRTIDSNLIKSIGYDNTQKVLQIEFRGGNVYQYAKVPPLRFQSLLKAKYKGYYLAKKIKPHFPVHKIEPKPVQQSLW